MRERISPEYLNHVRALNQAQKDDLWKRNRDYVKNHTFPLHALISKMSIGRNPDTEVLNAILKFA